MCIFQINMRQIGFIAMRISVGRFIYLFIRIRKKKWYRYMCVYVDYNKSYFGRLVTHAHRQIRVGCSFYIFHCCDVRIFASWLYSVKVYFIWILYNIYDFFFFCGMALSIFTVLMIYDLGKMFSLIKGMKPRIPFCDKLRMPQISHDCMKFTL